MKIIVRPIIWEALATLRLLAAKTAIAALVVVVVVVVVVVFYRHAAHIVPQ